MKYRILKYILIGVVLLIIIVVAGFLNEVSCCVDCIFTGDALAWIDENGNGVRDEQEQPFPNVRFHVDDTFNKRTDVGSESITNRMGEASLFVWLPGCPRVRMEVYPEIPQGFELTTSPRLKGGKNDETYEFGFAYLPGVPTATPNP